MKKKEITRTRIRVENIPQQLKDRQQWVCWHLEPGQDGAMTKVLYRPDGSRWQNGRRRKASHSDPQTWGPFEQALACFEGDTWYTGIGVTLANGLVGVDLDGFPQPRELPAWAARHVERLNTYTEWSPSQHGIHMLALGELPPGRRRTGPGHPHGIEMYDSQRFFTVTGDRLAGYDGLQERSAELAALHAEVFGDADARTDGDEGRSIEGTPDPRDEANEGYLVSDPIETYINALYVYTGDQNDYVTLPQVLDQLAMYHIPRTKETTMAVASVMRRLGADKNRKRVKGKRAMLYSKMKPRREAGFDSRPRVT